MNIPTTLLILGLSMPLAPAVITLSEGDVAGGDFGAPAAPTVAGGLGSPGISSILGVVNAGGVFDPDAFTITIPFGQVLVSASFSFLTGTNHFLAVNPGAAVLSGGGNAVQTLVSPASVGFNVLSSVGSFGGVGFVAPLPLPAGDYTFWLQELAATEVVNYTLQIETAAVPEPSILGMLGLCGLAALRRKRRA